MKNANRNWAILIAVVATLAMILAAWRLWPKGQDTGADGKGKLRIVAILPMTGPGASLGEFLKNGLELGKEEAERRHAGKLQVELEVLDSKNQPREGVVALQQALAFGDPDAVVCAMSSVSSAVVPIVEDRGITTIVTTTAMAGLPHGTRHVVRVYPTSEDFVTPVAEEMARRHKRVAVLYAHDDFGDSNRRVLTSLLDDAGVEVTAAEPFELTDKDFRALLAKVLSDSPEAVFVTGYGPAYIAIIRQLREADRTLPIYTEIGFANPAVLAGLGDAAEGIIFDGTDLELETPETEAARAFTHRYTERFGKKPYQVAGFARDAVVMLAEAAMTGEIPEQPTKAGLIALSPFEGAMGKIQLNAEGECLVQLELMHRVNGANRRLITGKPQGEANRE